MRIISEKRVNDLNMDLHKMKYLILLLIFLGNVAQQQAAYTISKETALRSSLFTGYSNQQRPKERVPVMVYLTLLTVNAMDIRNQILDLSGYFTVKWKDDRLSWHTSAVDYSMIKFLFSNEEYVWRPSLIIDNSVEDLTVINSKHIQMRIDNKGFITWNPAGIYKVACTSDITYYPLDQQVCTLSVSSWSYTTYEVTLSFGGNDPVDMSFYSENGEWELLTTTGMSAGDKARGDQSFANLKFIFTLRRRPMFHILNTLCPVALMAILSALVFKLPADSGEKIGFSLTVLLAYAVYLTLIAENIPSTSVNVCYLSVYLTMILAYGALSVVATILVLNVYHRPATKKIPNWLKCLTTYVLMPITCWKGCCKSCCCKKPKKSQVVPEPTPVLDMKHTTKENGSLANFENLVIDDLYEDYQDEEELTWQELSMVLDSLFFCIFMTLVLISTALLLTALFKEYINVINS